MPWDLEQYERFKAERAEPFWDLVGLVEFRPGMRIVDLGCGTGELTAGLASRSPGGHTLGIDSSSEMLARAPQADGLEFRVEEIGTLRPAASFDLVFSNAVLQWIPNHEALFPRLFSLLAPGGQIAVQMPKNEDSPTHTVARALAESPKYRSFLAGSGQPSTHSGEWYAERLFQAGASKTEVVERIYPHVLPDLDAVVEWVKGTLLVPYLERLDEAARSEFLADYRAALARARGETEPAFFPFRRLLVYGRWEGLVGATEAARAP